jgi:hypothetical protein
MLYAYGHPDQETPSKNSIISTPNFIFLRQKIHGAPLDITSCYGRAFND